MAVFTMGPLAKRRWRNFRANGRAFWSLWIFLALFGASLFAEFIANDKPFAVPDTDAMPRPVSPLSPLMSEPWFSGGHAVPDQKYALFVDWTR